MVYLRKPILEVKYSNSDETGNRQRYISYICPTCSSVIPREDAVICNNCDTLFSWDYVKFIELKPCPFCGAKDENIKVKSDYIGFGLTQYYVVCKSCLVNTRHFEIRKQAIEAWNRRADDGKEIP